MIGQRRRLTAAAGAGILATLFALGLQATGAQDGGDKKPPKKKQQDALSKFMRTKLTASEQILEGLCVEDFDLIEKGAAQLRKIEGSEQWRVSNDSVYRQRSNEFERIASKLEKAAKDKKLEAAALTWIEATMSCIECHRYVRSGMLITGSSRDGGLPPATGIPALGR